MKNTKPPAPQLLIICQLFYPELVSTGQTVTELAEALSDLGVQLQVVCGYPTLVAYQEPVPVRLTYRGIDVRRLPGTRFPKINFWGRLLNQVTFALSVLGFLLLRRPAGPILVMTNPPFLAGFCALARLLGGAPYYYLVFDVYPETAVLAGLLPANSWLTKLSDWWQQLALRHAEKVIVIGRCMQEIICRKLPAEQQQKVHLIHVWADNDLIANTVPDGHLVTRWQLQDKFVVLYAGNLGRFHELTTIVAAAKLLQDQPDIVFLFVGEGYQKKWLATQIAAAKLANCQLHSYVERAELGELLKSAHAGLVSLQPGQEGLSVPSKTFGLLAAGLPVLAIMQEQAEIARLVQEEACGFVVKQGDAAALAAHIQQLRDEPALRAQMGAQAQKAATEKYSLKLAAQAYYDLFWGNSPRPAASAEMRKRRSLFAGFIRGVVRNTSKFYSGKF